MNLAAIQVELRQAVVDLNSRCLSSSSRWAIEQLAGLNEELCSQHDTIPRADTRETASPMTDDRMLMLGRSFFEAREYQRAAHALQSSQGSLALFLRLYSVFQAGEAIKEQERVEKGGSIGRAEDGSNPALMDLESCLRVSLASPSPPPSTSQGETDPPPPPPENPLSSDPFLLYLFGIVLLERKKVKEGREALIKSIEIYPCNWSAWQALRPLCTSLDALQALPLPNHWARDFFLAGAFLDLHQNQEALSRLQRLSHVFPRSILMESLVAQAQYNLQNYDEAQALFEDILSRDPFRLEGVEVFSNILFVKEEFTALSQLAHRAAKTDRFRPESCCVMGNYYSLRGQHDKAVEYFKRALRLDPGCLAAWTLMGHEHMELKNTNAAVEAYRRAVDLNPNDFRAWYGLGQAYELLKMPFYAVYYYKRAASLRPDDARMWNALGQCYANDQVDMVDLAIRCFRKAIENNDPDGIAAHMLARLYCDPGPGKDLDAAEKLYLYNVQRLDQLGQPLGADSVEALLFLAARYRDTYRLEEAQACCERLLDCGGPAKEKAKGIVRDLQAIAAQQREGMRQEEAAEQSMDQDMIDSGGLDLHTVEGEVAASAIMQQLRIGRHQALMLLEQHGNALNAISYNLHLLEHRSDV